MSVSGHDEPRARIDAALLRELKMQADFLKDREPVYERLLTMLMEAVPGDLGARLARVWGGRAFHSPYERPLLLLAALRYDALREGPAHPLYATLSGDSADAGAVTPDGFAAALSPARTRVDRTLAARTVQTNETSRAVAWLWPAHLLWAAGMRRPIALVDLGTSAGLNLVADALPPLWSDERGSAVPIAPRPRVVLRLGLDVSPLDVRDPDAAMWLRACVWAGDRFRRVRLDEAIQVFVERSTQEDVVIEARALPDAPARLSSLPGDAFVLCVQTVVRDYLGPAERTRYEAGMRAFLSSRPRGALLAELEVDQASLGERARSATLTVRFADGAGVNRELLLARTHPHPRQLFIEPDALAAFAAAYKRMTT